jgi:hypothetical protein
MFGDDIDPELIDELMAETDTDGSGDIDLEEFKIIMRKGHGKFGSITKAMLTLRVRVHARARPCVCVRGAPIWRLNRSPGRLPHRSRSHSA